MNLTDIAKLLGAAKEQINHADFVILGSISVIGLVKLKNIPGRMLMSNDLDCYPLGDPGRAFDLNTTLGLGSPYEIENGLYLDPVSPRLPTLPTEWEKRLVHLKLDNGVTIHCLDPNDAAISKYARGEIRDREWIRAGLKGAILDIATISSRLRRTDFLDADEAAKARKLIEADRKWIASIKSPSSDFGM